MKNSEEPINPFHFEDQICSGLTKREYFAGLMMQAILSNPNYKGIYMEGVANHAIIRADDLLKQLDETPEP